METTKRAGKRKTTKAKAKPIVLKDKTKAKLANLDMNIQKFAQQANETIRSMQNTKLEIIDVVVAELGVENQKYKVTPEYVLEPISEAEFKKITAPAEAPPPKLQKVE